MFQVTSIENLFYRILPKLQKYEWSPFFHLSNYKMQIAYLEQKHWLVGWWNDNKSEGVTKRSLWPSSENRRRMSGIHKLRKIEGKTGNWQYVYINHSQISSSKSLLWSYGIYLKNMSFRFFIRLKYVLK